MTARPESDSSEPRLLVVMFDWLPAWMLPAYGATWVSAPSFDAFAATGIVFDRALAASVWGRETRRELFPFEDEPVIAGRCAEVDDLDAAAELVRSTRHSVVVCHVRRLGLSWDAPVEFRERYRGPEDPPAMLGSGPPCFATDEDTDPDLITVVRQAFAAEVTAIDQGLGRLIGAVDESSDRWNVCIAGTGGMPLGLHGQIGIPKPEVDCIAPYCERVHLPVILRDAGGRMAGQRFPGLVTASDIGATLGEWLGLSSAEPRSQVEADAGRSLASLFENWKARPRERLHLRGKAAAGLATPEWHLVVEWPRGMACGVKASLYAKPDDWFEVSDVADRCGSEADSLLRECLAKVDLPG